VLLVVDAISEFRHEDGGRLLDSFRERLPAMRATIDAARARRGPVVYVNDRHGRWDGDVRRLVDEAVAGAGGDVARALAPEPGDPFLLKSRYSAFDHTALELLLTSLEAERLVLVGGTTEGCIVQSGIDARELGFKVTIVADACTTIDTELEQIALRYAEQVAGIHVESLLTTAGAAFGGGNGGTTWEEAR
jgi:nicotinamidase-related amidase